MGERGADAPGPPAPRAAPLGGPRWALGVLAGYVRIGFVRKSQFRWEFFNQVLMDVLFYVSFILTFHILYGLEGGDGTALQLGGWAHDEMRVYLGFAFVADATVMTFLGQQWHFGQDLKNGHLDPFRVRPGSTAFLYFFQRFSPEGLTNMAIALGWLTYALANLAPDAAPHLALIPPALALILVAQVFLTIAYNTIELWVLNSDLGHVAAMLLGNLGERPLEVYPRGLKRFLLFVIPVGGIAWYPASLVLGRLTPAMALGYPLCIAAFGWVAIQVFRRGLRRYESAMG